MNSSSEIPRVVPNPAESEQICGQEERMDLPSTSTSKTLPIMPLNSKTNGERKNAVLDDQDVMPSAGRKPLDSIKSIYSSVQQLCSRVTEYDRRLFDLKAELEKLSVNPSLETLPDELVNILKASNKIIIDEKKNVNSHIVEIKEALEAISGKPQLPFDVDNELIDLLKLIGLGISFELILAQQMAQTPIFAEIKSLSVAISDKLQVKSSAVIQLLRELQSENEFDETSVEKSQSMILDLMERSLNELKD